MTDILNKTNREKHQFKSYYCAGCKQTKPCQLLTGWDIELKSYCCQCYYQNQQQKAQEYSNYEKVLASKQQERTTKFQQLQLLKNYQSCRNCGSKEVDTYSLYKASQLVCQPCLMSKENGASSPVSFLEQSKWYKRWWKVDLAEWLENCQCLPVNKNCAEQWLKNRNHLNSCQCLEAETREMFELFANSLKRDKARLEKECQCEINPKVRVGDNDITWCGKCRKVIPVASKKRVIKNRNDPRFWGLNVKERVLCGGCLEKKKEKMPVRKKYLFNEYVKREYWK